MEDMQKNIYLSEKQVATLLNLSPRTLQAWRRIEYGPPHRKFGRLVRYQRDEVERWIEMQRSRRPKTEDAA